MSFQFLCPQGHLLEGIESQTGQQCQCPLCGTAFIVPAPTGYTPPPQPYSAPAGPAAPSIGPSQHAPVGSIPSLGPIAPQTTAPEEKPAAPPAPVKPAEVVAPTVPSEPAPPEPKPEEDPNRIVRIPCPQGHELHTPMSMIGMEARCPECSEKFTLRYEDSLESKEEQRLKQERREQSFNKWLIIGSIGAAVVVVLGLAIMMILRR